MTHGSLFAGIGGFDEGFRRAGISTLWAVEKEPFCRAVLRSRFPGVELHKDVNDCGRANLRAVDIVTAGFPCQDVSVAGKRAGLAGSRTGLFWQLHRIVGELRPPWFLLENVPGLFSSNQGRDFAVVLHAMGELGYGLAWRVLDSQFFGVAQRRRRVFIVGRFGAPCPAEVLFEPEGGGGDSQAGGETWQDVAGTLAAGAHPSGFNGRDAERGNIVACALRESDGHHGRSSPRGDGCDNLAIVNCLSPVRGGADDNDAQAGHIVIQDARGQRDKRQNGIGIDCGGPSYTLDGTSQHAVAFNWQSGRDVRLSCGDKPTALQREQTPAVMYERSPSDPHRVRDFAGLPQGLDSARYRALGNAVTVQVAEWIGRRLMSFQRPTLPATPAPPPREG